MGDLDLLVACRRGTDVADRLVAHRDVVRVLARGSTRTSVVLRSGLQVDLRVVPPASFGAALHYLTGSKAHSIALRRLAVQLGLKLNEYGVYRGKERLGGAREEDVYRCVGLARELDLTICAVHSGFRLTSARQTERILRAMDDPHFHLLAHPTGRLLGEREPYALERVVAGAAERGCFLELDAQPLRLDLPDTACKLAREAGVKIAISSDAHDPDQLAYMDLGVGYATRGWLEAGDVLNTRSWPELERLLRR